MGIVAHYCIVNDEIINKVLTSEVDLDNYLAEKLMSHEYEGHQFEKAGILFWQGVKAWSPMYELIKFLDNSQNKVLSKIDNEEFTKAETEKTNRMNYYHSTEVKEVWTELRNISIGKIEDALDNPEIVQKISSIQGYWNTRIENKELNVLEFFELYKAFCQAHVSDKGIITSFE